MGGWYFSIRVKITSNVTKANFYFKNVMQVLEDKKPTYLNTEDPQKSNWLRFMRPAPERERRNITLAVQDKKLIFVATVDIPVGGELLYWADDHITSWSKKKILKSSVYSK